MTKEELHAFLRSRRSIRRFKPDPVPPDCLHRILETGMYAPSAHNLQPWRFAVITSPAVKARLSDAITDRFRQDMLAEGGPESDIQARVKRTIRRTNEAPAIVILCREKTKVKPQPDLDLQKKEAIMSTQSVALAGLQLLLAAHAEGLGGTWICWPLFAPDETRHALGLAPEWDPQGLLFLGYPGETPEMPERNSLQEVVRYI
jgi:coenzyme F420-0:L-glutamate ligase / coenzyme F420-1:gamma-L-glutamate ligase